METIGKRLKYFLKEKKVSVSEMSDMTGIPQPSIYRIFNSDSGLNSTTLTSIIENFPNLNITWLITGKGRMLNQQEPKYSNTVNESNFHYDTNENLEYKIKKVLNNEIVIKVLKQIIEEYDKHK